jgi:hypothetical protein
MVVINFGSLEYNLKMAYAKIFNLDFQGLALRTSKLSTKDFLNLFHKELKKKFITNEIALKRIERLIEKAKKLNSDRNNLIHSYFFIVRSQPDKLFKKYNMKQAEIENITIVEIETIAISFHKLTIEFIGFVKRFVDSDYKLF